MRTALLSLATVAALAITAGPADARPRHWRGGWGNGYSTYNNYRPYYGGYSYARPYYGGNYGSRYYGSRYYGSRYYNNSGFSFYTPRFGLSIGNGGFYPSYGYWGGGYRGWGW